MDKVAEVLTAGTDSICVHSIGYTLTLYRCTVSSFMLTALECLATAAMACNT
jgi:RNA-binding protein YhbY